MNGNGIINNGAGGINNNPNSSNMNTFELPPIRKIGPAVLPKPKNIKIQAGRGKNSN